MLSAAKHREINNLKRYALIAIGIASIFYFSLFVINNLRADNLYNKAVSQEKHSVDSEKIDYYAQILSLISKAIEYDKDNSLYYATKADYILLALSEGLENELTINEREAEKLYIKAVELRPTDFEYHLKLGWFYLERNDKKAEEELILATKLYPTGYDPRFYLMEYYVKNKNGKQIFNNLLLISHSSKYWTNKIFNELGREINNIPQIKFDNALGELKFEFDYNGNEFDLKKEKFPHAQIPLKFKVYIKNEKDEAMLYRGYLPYANFKKIETTPELSVYELYLNEFSSDVYLDDFKITTKLYSPIQKIEITKKL